MARFWPLISIREVPEANRLLTTPSIPKKKHLSRGRQVPQERSAHLMDQYTSDLLIKWGLMDYVSTFAQARIDITTLQLLRERDIASLIGPIGDQIRLKSNLEIWRQELTSADDVQKSMNTESEYPLLETSFIRGVLHDLNSPVPSTSTQAISSIPSSVASASAQTTLSQQDEQNRSHNNSVLHILCKSAEGRAVLTKGQNKGLLSCDLRKELASIVIRDILDGDKSKVLQGSDFIKLAHEIKEVFPQESPAVFYAPYIAQTKFQAKRNASGILFNIYNTKRKHLRRLGILSPSKRSRSKSSVSTVTSKDTANYIDATGIDITKLPQGNAEEVEENLALLESPDPGPWQNVERLWTTTIVARLRYLYYEKGNLADYLNRFPILKAPASYTLLLQDYKALYPEKNAGLCLLANTTKKIRNLAAAKAAVTKDLTIKKAIHDYLDIIDENQEETEVSASLLLLPYILNIPPVKRKGAWKPSRTEFRDGFILNAPSSSEVLPILAERRTKLTNLGVTFQPLVIYCGESVKAITKAYVVCEDTLYEFSSLPLAVDVAFKIFQATGAQYPQESYDIWLLLQVAFYEVTTQYDRPSSSLKQVLVDLSLSNSL